MSQWDTILARIAAFVKAHREDGDEKQRAATFLDDFAACFGLKVEHEVPVKGETTLYIDGLFPGKLLIEMKSRGKNLMDAWQQARAYCDLLGTEAPSMILSCDFEHWHLYDRRTQAWYKFRLRDLPKKLHLFRFLVEEDLSINWGDQQEVTIRAAEKMAKLCEALQTTGYVPEELPRLLTRLLFCVFADDTGIFEPDAFASYVYQSAPQDLGDRLNRLFTLLDADDSRRDCFPWLKPQLRKAFRYVNGGLFRGALPPAQFTFDLQQRLIDLCEQDWSNVSPAIFGSLFQSVTDPKARHDLGAHYTSEDNILKLIRPLFLDDLRSRLTVAATPAELDTLHDELARLSFLDPACGCGNFLIVAYRELRALELDLLQKRHPNPSFAPPLNKLLKVRVSQFHGIEVEPFPVQIAQTGLWLTDHLANLRVSAHFNQSYNRFPLRDSPHILHANALTTPWPPTDFIFGNPPFLGRRYRTAEQIAELAVLFPKAKDLDYVCAWYKLAANKIMEHPTTRAAFVSTNSITQGEQPALLWRNIPEAIKINFGVPTFKWSNEAKGKAAVHCVIIGFSLHGEDRLTPYLTQGSRNDFVVSRSTPLCKEAPLMMNGNVPLDGDALKVEPEELHSFADCPWIKRLIGGRELLHNEERYVLWLVGASPSELHKYPHVLQRIALCRERRLAMKDAGTRALAETPTTFRDTNNPQHYIAMPMVSSEKRKYLPMMYLTAETIPTNQVQIIPEATLYHFGVLTSWVHNAWMRAVCGRLEMRYRYSKDIVYNNFPWPEATEAQRKKIEETAQAILDARAAHPESSLADLYNPLTMPQDLLKAHQANDRAVLAAYAAHWSTESECVTALMLRYKQLVISNC